MVNKFDLFVGSQATDFGEALKYVHEDLWILLLLHQSKITFEDIADTVFQIKFCLPSLQLEVAFLPFNFNIYISFNKPLGI